MSQERGLHASWAGAAPIAQIVAEFGTPVFIYSADALRANISRVQQAVENAGLAGRVKLYVPFFPNSNPHVLRPLREVGLGLLVQIPSEYEYTRQFGFDDFIVSPGHISNDEIAYWTDSELPTFLGSLGEISAALTSGSREICARIDSLNSGKPGLKMDELDHLRTLLDEHSASVSSLEVYCGSGNSHDEMLTAIDALMSIYRKHLPEARSLNFAGGFGFDYEGWETGRKHFTWDPYCRALAEHAVLHSIPEDVEFWFEPARDLLADTGILVLGVKREVLTNAVHSLVPTDGTRMLMPSAQLRGRRHNIAFLDADFAEIVPEPSAVSASIRGRTILRNDYLLPHEYPMPAGLCPGCHLVVMDVGAYCATQHMEFLNVPPAAEVVVDERDGVLTLAAERGNRFDKWRNVRAEPRTLVAAGGA